MLSRIRLLLLIPHLGGGGAEQVTAQLAIHLDPRRFEVHLATSSQDHSGAPSLPSPVEVHRLAARRVRYAWRPILSLVHRLQPNLIFSGMAHLSFLLLAMRPVLPRGTRILVRQNTTASSASRNFLYRFGYRRLYPRADKVLCQSQAMADDLAHNFAIASQNLTVLANPIAVSSIRTAAESVRRQIDPPSPSAPRILCVARLSGEKGIDLLLQAFAFVLQTYPEARLTILGIGTLQSELQYLARTLAIDHAVSFPGFRTDLISHYAQSSLFVLPSRYEGMPNAVLEAASARLPIVTTPASMGLLELLHKAPGVWIAPSITAESLAEAILIALDQLDSREEMDRLFDHAFLSPFETSTAIANYSACFEQVASQPRA